MFGEFPMGNHWAAKLFAAVLPPSRFGNVHIVHREAVASQLVRAVMSRSADLDALIERVHVAYAILDRAWDRDPERIAAVVDATFHRLGELQEREASLERDIHHASKDDLEARFGSHLVLYEFTSEQYYRTVAAPYVAADAISRTGEAVDDLIDGDGRANPARMKALEAGRGIRAGAVTDGLDRHLRNSAAHHRYSIIDDNHIRLRDVDPKTRETTWGPVEWTFWELRTNVYRLSNTCSVLLLGMAMFDIAYGPTMRARGWGSRGSRPRPKRRDIAKAELSSMADLHGFTVEGANVTGDGALSIALRVKGETRIAQTTAIIAGVGGAASGRYHQDVRTAWGTLRNQVYGFLQTTYDVHGGYEVVRVTVTAKDGKASLGQVDAPVAERDAMLHAEDIDTIRARLAVDTLADEKIPVIVKGPIVPVP
jgi:hypothetical protein